MIIRHLYKPLLGGGVTRPTAALLVFFLSAFFHEYLVSVPLQMFKPWAFLGMLGQVPLIVLSKRVETKWGPRLGNLTVWASLIIGHPLALMIYYHDFVIQNYGHSFLLNSAM